RHTNIGSDRIAPDNNDSVRKTLLGVFLVLLFGLPSQPDRKQRANTMRPRIFIADDHTLIVEAFEGLLAKDFEIVGTASDGRSLLEEAPKLKPDVILLD